jgi:hypothetical protein
MFLNWSYVIALYSAGVCLRKLIVNGDFINDNVKMINKHASMTQGVLIVVYFLSRLIYNQPDLFSFAREMI